MEYLHYYSLVCFDGSSSSTYIRPQRMHKTTCHSRVGVRTSVRVACWSALEREERNLGSASLLALKSNATR